LSFICIDLGPETSSLFDRIKVPEGTVTEDRKHVTLFFIPKEVETVKNFYLAVEILRRVIGSTRPPTLLCSEVTTFSKGEDGFPIICPVRSIGLFEVRRTIAEAFDRNGVSYSKKFPKYQPHVTLGYTPEDIQGKEMRSPIIWTANNVTHYFSSEAETNAQELSVDVPFAP